MLTDENLIEINSVLDACNEIRLSDKEVRWLGYKNASVTEIDDIYIIAQMVIIKRDKMRTRHSESLQTIIDLAYAEGVTLFGETLEKKETIVPLLCGGFSIPAAAVVEEESDGGDCGCDSKEFEYYLNRCKEEALKAEQSAALSVESAESASAAMEESARNAAATKSDREQVSEDAEQVALDRIQTGKDAVTTSNNATQTNLDAESTAADRIQTGKDAAESGENAERAESAALATAADREQVSDDAEQVAADRIQTGKDAESASDSETESAKSAAESLESEKNAKESEDAILAAEARLSELAGIMSESEARAIQSLNENKYAASGMVQSGKHDSNNINDGMFVDGVTSNTVFVGGGPDGSSKTDFAVNHIAGSVINAILENNQFKFELRQAPDGAVIYDSTGDARDSGKANLDLKVDADPKYNDVPTGTEDQIRNEAVARAFEGAVKNGDGRFGEQDWHVTDPESGSSITQGVGFHVITTNVDTGIRAGSTGSLPHPITANVATEVKVVVSDITSGGVKLRLNTGLGWMTHNLLEVGEHVINLAASEVTSTTVWMSLYATEDVSDYIISNISIRPATEEVVTHPVDLVMFECYEEELTGRQEIFECTQSLSTTFGDTDVPTVLSTRPLSYFQQYDGQFADPALQNDQYRCVVWDDLTDEQKRKVAAYMGEKLFVGENGNLVNGRLRARTIRGAGNGDWFNVNSNDDVGSGQLKFAARVNTSTVRPQGVFDTVAVDGVSDCYYSTNSEYNINKDKDYRGVWSVRYERYAYKGRCFAYVVATVPRANQGVNVKGVNKYGTAKCSDDKYWYESANKPTTLKDCFIGQVGGDIASGASGHPSGIFYDGIGEGGLNGVIDWRLSAEEMQSQWLYAERKHECAKYRGTEILADNTSVSGKFMHTYTEAIGGSVTLPRTCLDSTVECVHSSDGGATWAKTNPTVNQSNNTVTLPVSGESVVSFHTYAKQTAPSSNAPVVSGTFGLGPVMVQNSSDIKRGALLRESVTGVISTGTEYTNLGILRSTIVDELVIDYEVMTYTPEAGSAQLQSQLVEENGQLFIQYHDGTSYHRSAISIGWADQRAHVGGENAPT
ncbi:coil containing protein [Vibrio phage 1.155.O._10N.222.55.B3]|nr:coil containing protein [Vibrio phage 1.155.O._10N.222.55.B3]